jgi:nickel transport protein
LVELYATCHPKRLNRYLSLSDEMSGAIMKSIARWSATVGLIGSACLGSLLAGTIEALALPKEQILQKLLPVPVFTIANNEGAPLVVTPAQGQKGQPVAGVFISQKDAQAFLDGLKTRNPELAKSVQVVPISLAEVYQLTEANKGKPDGLSFAYVPSKQQIDSALTLLKQSGDKNQQFNGTPLFVAWSGKEKVYLTTQQGNQTAIPMFFKKEDLQASLDRFKQQEPNLASTIEIQVLNLEWLMNELQTKDDPQLNRIVLIPPQDSLEFIRSLIQTQPKPGAPNTQKPASAPKK